MATKITSPIEGFTGRTTIGPLTLDFQDGVAETDEKIPDAIGAYLHRRGYTTGRAKAPKTDPDAAYPAGVPSDEWTVDQLKAWAGEHDVDLTGVTVKADILDRITNPGPGTPVEPSGGDQS